MSILLDAVIRQKNQTSPDPLHAHLQSPVSKVKPSSQLPMLALSMLVGVALGGGSYALLNSDGVAQWLSSSTPNAQAIEEATELAKAAKNKQTEIDTQAPSVIRSYQRVSLPLAQERHSLAMNSGQDSGMSGGIYSQSYGQNYDQSYDQNYGQVASAEAMDEDVELAETGSGSGSGFATANSQPLILGNTNLTAQQQRIIAEAMAADSQMAQVNPQTNRQTHAEPKDLVAAFQEALKQVEYQHSMANEVSSNKLNPIPQDSDTSIPKLGELPYALQAQVPDFSIVAHVYASSPQKRWLNVDGVELQQGDSIAGGIKIIEIRPRDVVMEMAGTQFRVPAI
ncbi:MAG: general secretion pathway protein GspB [Shewanella sp.]